MILRDYQVEAVEAVKAAGDRGVKKLLAVLPTGGGKTVIFATLIAEVVARGGTALVLAHRDELLTQAREKLVAIEPTLEMATGLVKAGSNDVNSQVVVASVQTLARQSRLAQLPTGFDLVVVDEGHHCHVGGTLVDTPDGERAIESLRRGDEVIAWDGSRLVRRRVLNTWRHQHDGPVHRLTTDSGRQVCVTPNHRLYSEGERIYARDIGVGADLSVRPLRLDDDEDERDPDALPLAPQGRGVQTLSGLLGGAVETGPGGPHCGASQRPGRMRELWRVIHQAVDRRPSKHLPARQCVCRSGDTRCGDGEAEREPGVPQASFRADARRAEPDGGCRRASAHGGDPAGQDRTRRDDAVRTAELRQRRGADADRGGGALSLPGRGVAVRRDDGRRGTSLPLQARCGMAVAQGRARLGRLLSPDRRAPRGRRAQGPAPRRDRVVDDPRTERGCALGRDRVAAFEVRHHVGWVYDLEVAEDHNYVANGVLSSNSTAPSYQRIMDHVEGTILLVTATPERADGKSLETIVEEMVFARSIEWMVEQGYLCPPRGKRISVDVDLAKVKKSHGDFQADALADALENADALSDILATYVEHGEGRKTLIFCPTVAMAHHTAEVFRSAGLAAEAVDGTTPEAERHGILRRLHTGETQIVANVGVLCLDMETEILTDSGWVGPDDITPEHRVANWDDGKIHFEPPLEIVRRPRMVGEGMVTLGGPRFMRDLRVTETHRMLYRRTGGWTKVPARDLVGRGGIRIPAHGVAEPSPVKAEQPLELSEAQRKRRISANAYTLRKREGYHWDESFEEATRRLDRRLALRRKDPAELTEDECRFIGFWIGDGSVGKLRRGGLEYSLSQATAYPAIIEWVDALVDRLGFDAARRERDWGVAHVRWSFGRGTGYGTQERNGVFGIEPYLDKSGSPLLWGFDQRQFAALIEGWWFADGDHGLGESVPTTLRIGNADRDLLSLVQAIGAARGYYTNITGNGKVRNPRHRPLWQLTLRKGGDHSIGNRHGMQAETGWKSEEVWCVKTTTKNIVTRRNGSVVVMGNTEGFDEPSISCIILAAPTKSRVKYTQIVGRGLRLYPEKQDCLILDVVGASEDNSIQSLPALFGLKDLLDDEDVIEGREREAREASEAETARAIEDQDEQAIRDERRRRNAESIQFFSRGRMNWTTIDDKWTIPLDRFRTLVLWPTAGEHFDVLLLNEERETFKFLARGLDLGYAQGAAEETIRKHGNRLLADSKAAWREDEVTPGQRRYLGKLQLPVPDTKGEAADLITEAKVAGLLERVERAILELEAVHEFDLEPVA